MKQVVKYFKVLITLILLGGISGVVVQSRSIFSQRASLIKIVNIPVVSTQVVVVEPTHTRILFTGDINLGRCIARRTLSANVYTNDYNYPFEFVADELRGADITVGSLDGSLSDESAPMHCPDSMNLIGPTRMVEGLQFAGFDVLTTATNHIKDCGINGFECGNRSMFDTINTLQTAGIQSVGAGKTLSESRLPVIVERNGIRFAFLGINQIEKRVWAAENTPGTAPLSQEYIEQIKADIASARQIADVVIVLPHWGVEYAAAPDDIQRVWARDFISAGASLVIGNHPHIIQPEENFSDKLVFYALGNFVFDQEQSFRRESVVVEVNFVGDQIESWQLRPISINYYTFQPHWAEDSEAEYILARANK
jgi:poly-gamma-glutamate synthesis protein (capsule biosynthesis protein)